MKSIVRALRWISHDAKPYRLIVMSPNGSNPYNATTTPVTETTKAISSTSNVPFNYDLVSMDPDGSIAGNTFLTGFGGYGTRSQDHLASKIRGSSGVVQKYQNAYRVFHQEALVYQCKYFKLNYYPPEHFLGLFRKTKPAVNVRESGEAHFNNNLQLENAHKSIFRNNISSLPKHYAVYRRLNRIFIKRHMVEEWCRLHGDKAVEEAIGNKTSKTGAQQLDRFGRTKQGVAKDGFYVYMSLIFPDQHNREDIAHHVRQSVSAVANLKWDQFLQSDKTNNRSWVETANSSLKPFTINKLLSQSEHSYTLSRFEDELPEE
ncbi:hypothetical protein ZYGR_0AI05790 [Zygosaccharomyces rouxii]|uniref:Uncharacterized protein n=1 Tax=Zygosaccharomyces rouxii TaxID=4956 RepID=A0A1Q3ACF6_ZYGRO|nr:hypothetical protein ZYGR_0AI05790 [Zygosaccharomyces rouxii]